MEAIYFSETVPTYEYTRRYNPEQQHYQLLYWIRQNRFHMQHSVREESCGLRRLTLRTVLSVGWHGASGQRSISCRLASEERALVSIGYEAVWTQSLFGLSVRKKMFRPCRVSNSRRTAGSRVTSDRSCVLNPLKTKLV
jgi:hypothetical protein